MMRANGLPESGLQNPSFGAPVYPDGTPTIASGARYLDSNGCPVIDPATGGFVKVDRVMMQVYLAVRTNRGAASGDPALGSKFPSKIGKRFESELLVAAQTALLPLIQSNTITLNSVRAVQLRPGAYNIEIDYTNRLSGGRRQVIV